MPHFEFINTVFRIRKAIIKKDGSPKNKMDCLKRIDRLSKLVKAYKEKWTTEQWKAFLTRHYNDIVFLIPANQAGKNLIAELDSLIL